MKKKIIGILLLAMILSCKKEEVIEETVVRVSVPIAPYSIPTLYMMEENLLGENIKLDIKLHKSRQEAVARIVKKEVDIVSLSVQEIAQLYNQDIPINLLYVSNWATFRLLTTQPSVQDFRDLEGKDVWVSGKGGPIDLVSVAILAENGLKNKINFTLKRMEVVGLTNMAINELKGVKNFVLREPYSSQVLLTNLNSREIYNLGDEWEKKYGYKIPQSGTAVVREFKEANSNLVEKYITAEEEAIEWVKNNPEKAAKLGAKYLAGLSEEVLLESIYNMDIEIKTPGDSIEALEIYYSMFLKHNPTMIGGKLPNSSFYNSNEK